MAAPLSDADLTEFVLGSDRFAAASIAAECEHADL
jgi:hypothetical protein